MRRLPAAPRAQKETEPIRLESIDSALRPHWQAFGREKPAQRKQALILPYRASL